MICTVACCAVTVTDAVSTVYPTQLCLFQLMVLTLRGAGWRKSATISSSCEACSRAQADNCMSNLLQLYNPVPPAGLYYTERGCVFTADGSSCRPERESSRPWRCVILHNLHSTVHSESVTRCERCASITRFGAAQQQLRLAQCKIQLSGHQASTDHTCSVCGRNFLQDAKHHTSAR